MYGSSEEKACNSPTLLAEMMAKRNITFRLRNFSCTCSSGSKGWPHGPSKTTDKSHCGTGLENWRTGGLILVAAFRTLLISGSFAKEKSMAADRAATCTFSVAGLRPLSKPSCKNSRIPVRGGLSSFTPLSKPQETNTLYILV